MDWKTVPVSHENASRQQPYNYPGTGGLVTLRPAVRNNELLEKEYVVLPLTGCYLWRGLQGGCSFAAPVCSACDRRIDA
jgi:hypothetical protein